MVQGNVRSWDVEPTWDVPIPDLIGDEPVNLEDQEEDWESLSPEVNGHEFCDMLMDLMHRNRLSARDVCVLSWFAHHAGAKGPVGLFKLSPVSPTGPRIVHGALSTASGHNIPPQGSSEVSIHFYGTLVRQIQPRKGDFTNPCVALARSVARRTEP